MEAKWDEQKRVQNLATHQLDMQDFKGFQWQSAILRPTYSGQFGQRRFKAIGFLNEDLVAAVLSGLGREALSSVSLRRASRAERREYEQSQAGP
jgi:hypothetical protein